MERRDYLMDQINEIGLFIAKLLGKLRDLDEQKEEDQLLSEAKDALTVQFGWELEEMLFMENTAFISLIEESLLAESHYEQLAEIFHVLGDHALEHQTLLRKELYYQKALCLLKYVDIQSSTYSMLRRNKIVNLEAKLNN
ncbi:hypothetical protein [Mangrovibacterium sp.]|uniref:hypothetical protein n=1 Tax=Mangrovibacterium sp. TaxID=1961364 RepID=UPI0035627C32